MPMKPKVIRACRVTPGRRLRLTDHDPGLAAFPELSEADGDTLRRRARAAIERNLAELSKAQELLWASDVYAVLVVLQAMDAAGKDGTIKHVMSGLNPQACRVVGFKVPSPEEMDHHFLWRYAKRLPERGQIGIFNRSYYEEVLVVRVREDVLARQKLPPGKRGRKFWADRYDDINRFERHLVRNGTLVLKFFLNISKEEQRRRFLERLENPKKHWKWSAGDLAERARWDDYMEAYEQALTATSTKWAPWYVVPADHKWMARAFVAEVLTRAIRKLDLRMPEPTAEELAGIEEARRELESDE